MPRSTEVSRAMGRSKFAQNTYGHRSVDALEVVLEIGRRGLVLLGNLARDIRLVPLANSEKLALVRLLELLALLDLLIELCTQRSRRGLLSLSIGSSLRQVKTLSVHTHTHTHTHTRIPSRQALLTYRFTEALLLRQ